MLIDIDEFSDEMLGDIFFFHLSFCNAYFSPPNKVKMSNPSHAQEGKRYKQSELPPSLSLSSLSKGGLAGTRLSSSPGETHNGRLAALIPQLPLSAWIKTQFAKGYGNCWLWESFYLFIYRIMWESYELVHF